MIGFSQVVVTEARGRFGDKQSCANAFALLPRRLEFRTDSDGIRFGIRTRLCCVVSEPSSSNAGAAAAFVLAVNVGRCSAIVLAEN